MAKWLIKLAEKAKRIYIAGDDDQAIFNWAGARSEYLLNREGNRIILDKSYRLPIKNTRACYTF